MNIRTIAEKAGVSVATVSRVINNKPNISPTTYQKVMDVMREDNYKPNAIARGLSLNSMKMVGIIIDDIRNLYRANVVYYLESNLSHHGYNTLIFNIGANSNSFYSQITQQHLDALIFAGSSLGTPELRDFIQKNFPERPVLMYNGQLDLPNTFSVICDEYSGLQLIADHLYRTGRRKPIYIDYPYTPASRRKYHGFSDKLYELNVPFDQSRVINTDSGTFDHGYAATKQAIEQRLPFDSVVCCLDLLALGAIHALKQYGYQIPHDISVTGFDNLIYGKLSSPFLTSIDGNVDKMAQIAIELLVQSMSGEEIPKEPVYIAPSLYLGETT